MFYEEKKCAFISLQPHPINTMENRLRNQQSELVFKSTQNGWINEWLKFLTMLDFKQRIDMENQKQNFIGFKGRSKYRDIIVL